MRGKGARAGGEGSGGGGGGGGGVVCVYVGKTTSIISKFIIYISGNKYVCKSSIMKDLICDTYWTSYYENVPRQKSVSNITLWILKAPDFERTV